jgi:hypothetical protein
MKSAHLLFLLAGLFGATFLARSDDNPTLTGATKVQLAFLGGYDTDPRDHGRPVVLVAAALGVPPQVFRDAFSHVHPAPAGEQPTQDEVHDNKRQLLSRLAPYGVTNERLDEVSNYYRYRPESGQLWRHVEAEGYAIVGPADTVIRVVITNPGSGYTTPPNIDVGGTLNFGSSFTASLSFGTDLNKNGSISSIKAAPRPAS